MDSNSNSNQNKQKRRAAAAAALILCVRVGNAAADRFLSRYGMFMLILSVGGGWLSVSSIETKSLLLGNAGYPRMCVVVMMMISRKAVCMLISLFGVAL